MTQIINDIIKGFLMVFDSGIYGMSQIYMWYML